MCLVEFVNWQDVQALCKGLATRLLRQASCSIGFGRVRSRVGSFKDFQDLFTGCIRCFGEVFVEWVHCLSAALVLTRDSDCTQTVARLEPQPLFVCLLVLLVKSGSVLVLSGCLSASTLQRRSSTSVWRAFFLILSDFLFVDLCMDHSLCEPHFSSTAVPTMFDVFCSRTSPCSGRSSH